MKEILFFSGEGCPQCKALKPNFEAECKRLGFTNYTYIDIESEENEDYVGQYHLRSIPVLVFLDNGVEVNRAYGVMAWKQIEEFLR